MPTDVPDPTDETGTTGATDVADGTDGWVPDQYGRFADERAQPFWDLVALVERDRPIRRAVDLGCGSGELTAALADRLGVDGPAGADTGLEMTGIDSSPAMLAAAAAHARPGLSFRFGDLGTWTGAADHDLVLANASLQWVPDHPSVLARWVAALDEGGQLAVQVPANGDHPSHVVAARLAAEEPWRSLLGGSPPPDAAATNVLAPEAYATVLHELGLRRQHVRLQVYAHVLGSSADVVEWVRGSTLTRFATRWSPGDHERFVAAYRERLLDEIGRHSPYLYPFKRILLWGRR